MEVGAGRRHWQSRETQGEAGSGLSRRTLPCQCGAGGVAPARVGLKEDLHLRTAGLSLESEKKKRGLVVATGATTAMAARRQRQLGSCCVVVPGPDVSGNMGLGDTRSVFGW
jgi:hypothetical protein